MVCVNSDMIKLWTISEELSKLYVAGREDSNFSNSNLRLRLYKPCLEIALVMTNNLIYDTHKESRKTS
jgi:hypothetical protein